VPFDQVWRAGANENTTIEFTDPVTIAQKEIPAGKYGIHMIPGREEWTVILSSVYYAWGSFSYDENEDVVRFKVKPVPADHTERLIYFFDNPTEKGVDVVMQWEKLRISFPVNIDVVQNVLANIRQELRSLPRFFWQGWNQAANFCLQNDVNLDEAMQWVNRSIAMNENFNNLRVKAGLLEKQGQQAGADELMEKGLNIATEAELNLYGYQLIGAGELDKAIGIFKLNIERHPDSWNVYDSLGEAYAQKGETKLAIEYYQKALDMVKLDNQKKRIEDILKGLQAK
jgi:tetratricopeptide (TPR) repeat protein